MSQNLSSAAVVIGALRVKEVLHIIKGKFSPFLHDAIRIASFMCNPTIYEKLSKTGIAILSLVLANFAL